MELILLCAGRSHDKSGPSGICFAQAPTDLMYRPKDRALSLSSAPFSPFGAEDAAHVARFTNVQSRRLRVQARSLLWFGLQSLYGLYGQHAWGRCPDNLPDGLPATLSGLTLHHDCLGRPSFSDARLQCSISYAKDQVFCLLGLTEHGAFPRLGLDCEELRFNSLPPLSMLSQREQQELFLFLQLQAQTKKNTSSLSDQSPEQENELCQKTLASSCLRRWCVREALLKAHGTGLRLNPSSLNGGFLWQRCGMQHIEGHRYAWRCLALQGLWVCLAIEEQDRALLHRVRLVRVDRADMQNMVHRLDRTDVPGVPDMAEGTVAADS